MTILLLIATFVAFLLWLRAYLSSAEDAIPNGIIAVVGTAFVAGGWAFWILDWFL
jgi:uncharacterized membrane-anchored protein